MEKDEDKPKAVVSYYGKKTYCIDTMIASKKASKEKMPDYREFDQK